jgi:hypothetical protein
MKRKIQLFKNNVLYVFEFPFTYNTKICERIINLTIEKHNKTNKSIAECKLDATKDIFKTYFTSS